MMDRFEFRWEAIIGLRFILNRKLFFSYWEVQTISSQGVFSVKLAFGYCLLAGNTIASDKFLMLKR